MTSAVLTAWRLVKARHADGAFSGEGARRYGGRWNRPGTAVVYLADSLALAALEQFVHLGRAHASMAFVAFRVRIPADLVEELPTRDLPANWRQQPPPRQTMDIGSRWAAGGASAVLRVPSVVVPVEHNYVLNPNHADFARIDIDAPVPFGFDPRMWKA